MDSLFSSFESIDVTVFDSSSIKDSVDKEYRDLFFDVVERIKPVIAKHTCRVACSFGKDSNLVLSATVEAYRQAIKSGLIEKDKPLIVTNIDTGVDDIFVRAQIRYEVAELKRYCKANGINLIYRSATPPVRYSWSVMYLSGMKLPSFAKSSADCSVILKIDPAKKLESELSKTFGDIVTILGVRNDESTRRSNSIKRHGLDDVSIIEKSINGKTVRTFAPIVDLSTDDVFAILRRSGAEPIVETNYPIPTYKAHNKLLIKLYGDAQETCPVASFQPAAEARSGSCGNGSRFGCFTCLKVVKDRSANARERFAQYERVKHVKRIRDWMAHHADDMTTRAPMGKSMCPITGAIVVQENTYSAQTLEKLIWWFSQATREDYLFVERFKALLAQGTPELDEGYAEIANDPDLDEKSMAFYLAHYVEASTEHLIQPLTIEHIMMICAIHARDGIALPPYRALHIWNEVWNGNYIPWPVIEGEPANDAVPDPRFYFGNFSKTADAKLNFLLADDTTCASQLAFHSDNGYPYVNKLRVDQFVLPTKAAAASHSFTRRKVKKVKRGNGYALVKGRMSVNFGRVPLISRFVADAEKTINLPIVSTERFPLSQVSVWSDEDVETGFSIDHDALENFLFTEYTRCLEKHDDFVKRRGVNQFGGTSPFVEMANYGLLRFTAKALSASERMLARTEQLCMAHNGLSLLNMTKQDLEQHTVKQEAYRTIKAKALLKIRAARHTHKAQVKALLKQRESSSALYFSHKLDVLFSSVDQITKKLLNEQHLLIALHEKGVYRFDGIFTRVYLDSIEHCLTEISTAVFNIDNLIKLYGFDKRDVELRKLAHNAISNFLSKMENPKWVVRENNPVSTWTSLVNYNKISLDDSALLKLKSDFYKACKASSGKAAVYASKGAFNIMSLPIMSKAS